MTTILEGFYKQGTIELLQTPSDLPEGRVRVIVIAGEQHKPPPSCLRFGKYFAGRMSNLEDFKDAEWPAASASDDNRCLRGILQVRHNHGYPTVDPLKPPTGGSCVDN
jgi:hypothetical protein